MVLATPKLGLPLIEDGDNANTAVRTHTNTSRNIMDDAVLTTLTAPVLAGNLGLGGVGPLKPWTGHTALVLSGRNAVNSNPTGGIGLVNNAYLDTGPTWKYAQTGAASLLSANAGILTYSNAASGSADAALTWVERLRVDTLGHIGVNAAARAEWPTASRVVDIDAGTASIYTSSAGVALNFGQNHYFDGSQWRVTLNAATAHYQLYNGYHYWYTNASPGAAGGSYSPATRMILDVGGHLGINGLAPAWAPATYRSLGWNSRASIAVAPSGDTSIWIANNVFNDDVSWKYITTGKTGELLRMNSGALYFYTFVSGTGGQSGTPDLKFYADASGVGLNGGLPDSVSFVNAVKNVNNSAMVRAYNSDTGSSALVGFSAVSNAVTVQMLACSSAYGSPYTSRGLFQCTTAMMFQCNGASGGAFLFYGKASGGSLLWYIDGGATGHLYTGADNTYDIGAPAASRPRDVYIARGAINGSSRELKREIAPLDADAALALARRVGVVTYRYRPTGDDDAGAERVRVGFVAEDAPDLLSPDHKTADPQTTASVALGAVQALDARLARLEARLGGG